VLSAVLCAAAFVAGLTGSWSPCGFSMIASLGSHDRGRAATVAACLAFAPGALLGGAITFGVLASAGALLGGGDVALLAAALLVGAAAVAEITGRRIAPQIRRQVPEHWRRVLPLPVAAAGYGVLLGMGFTTFVLTFAVPALAGVALAVGDPVLGLLVGLAFGAGRALPIVALAPVADAPAGVRATELMAERPGILRGFRVADAVALALAAVALSAESAGAATPRAIAAGQSADPSVSGTTLAYRVPGGQATVLTARAAPEGLGAERAAVGGGRVALVEGDTIRVRDLAGRAPDVVVPAPGADQVAVSATWLAWRRAGPNGDEILAAALAGGPVAQQTYLPRPGQLGRPALDGDRLVFHVAGRDVSRIVEIALSTGARQDLRRETRRALSNPSLAGEELAYVETTPWSQALVLTRRTSRKRRTLLRIAPSIAADRGYDTDHGPHRRTVQPVRPRREGPAGSTTTLWTTALAADAAYVTRVQTTRGGRTTSTVLRVAR
jgi:hypothetical protein